MALGPNFSGAFETILELAALLVCYFNGGVEYMRTIVPSKHQLLTFACTPTGNVCVDDGVETLLKLQWQIA